MQQTKTATTNTNTRYLFQPRTGLETLARFNTYDLTSTRAPLRISPTRQYALKEHQRNNKRVFVAPPYIVRY